MKVKEILTKKIFGVLPVFALIALIGIGGVSAALLNYYGMISGTADVEQSVLVDGQAKVAGAIEATYNTSFVAGKTFRETHTINNSNDEKTISVDFETTCYKGATQDNGVKGAGEIDWTNECKGIDTKYVEYFDDAGATDTGADLSTYEAPTSCDVTVDTLTSLQNAVTKSDNADKTICVKDGTYSGQIDITVSGITLASKTAQGATIDVSSESGYGILVEANDVTIKGFEIIGVPVGASADDWDTKSGSEYDPTIKTVADGTTVRDCLFSKPSGAKGKEAMVAMPGTSDIKFINNEVNSYVYGITARGNNYGGSATLPGDGVTNLEVSSNTFNVAYIRNDNWNGGNTNIVGEGVQIHYGDNIVVADNTINGAGKFDENWGDNDLINSIGIVDYMSGYGAAGTVTYRNNKVDNCYVAVATFARGGEITSNTITGSTTGIQVGQNSEVYIDTPAEGVGITSNHIDNNKKGIWVQDFAKDGLVAHQNNLVSNTEYDVQNDDSDTFDATENWWGTDGIQASGNVDVSWKLKENPVMLSPSENDKYGFINEFDEALVPAKYTITSRVVPK